MEFHGEGAGGLTDFSRRRASSIKKLTRKDWPAKYPAVTQRCRPIFTTKSGDTNERVSMVTHRGGGGAGGSAELSARASMRVWYDPIFHDDDCSPRCFPRTKKWHYWLLKSKKHNPLKVKGLNWRRRSFSAASAANINEEWYVEHRGRPPPSMLKQILEKFRVDDRCKSILPPYPTAWEEKVVEILHMVRCRELTELHSKYYLHQPTRFCDFNIAFFDLDKESEFEHVLPLSEIPPSKLWRLDDSVNIISIQIARSGIPDPIHIYGTVLARDENDYRCVYLFKRGRDEPQLITRQNRTLALTGPYRALGGRSFLYFEFHLKIKGKEEAVDQDFSKGLLVLNLLGCGSTPCRLTTLSLDSCLSIVDLVYVYVPCASEASVRVNYSNGRSDFTGKICAWTSRDDGNKIILYDSEVAGTKTKLGSRGSVSLSRSVISVPLDEDLVLSFSFSEGNYNTGCLEMNVGHNDEGGTLQKGNYNTGCLENLEMNVGHNDEGGTLQKGNYNTGCLEMNVGHSDEGGTLQLGPYELQVNVIWKAVARHRIPKLWKYIKHNKVLW